MDKYCCEKCFADEEIIKFVQENGEEGDCDYCSSENIFIYEVHEVGRFIEQGVYRKYEDPANSVGYCSQDGGYLLPVLHIDEILLDHEIVFSELFDASEALLNDLGPFETEDLVRKDPYGPETGEPEEIESWESFRHTVITKKPFTSLYNLEGNFDSNHPSTFLEHLSNYLLSSNLIWPIDPGKYIYRARIVKEKQELGHSDLTSPPIEKTKNNRMSPAGISFFYGCYDKDTCIYEMRPTIGEIIAVTTFEITKSLNILDLTEIPDSPEPISIFNEEYSFEYESSFKPFLYHFANDIAKPIKPNETEIMYRPTQVFTEFIQYYEFTKFEWPPFGMDPKKEKFYLNGMAFKSSLNQRGNNIVLFKGPDISLSTETSPEEPWLDFKGIEYFKVDSLDISSSCLGDSLAEL